MNLFKEYAQERINYFNSNNKIMRMTQRAIDGNIDYDFYLRRSLTLMKVNLNNINTRISQSNNKDQLSLLVSDKNNFLDKMIGKRQDVIESSNRDLEKIFD